MASKIGVPERYISALRIAREFGIHRRLLGRLVDEGQVKTMKVGRYDRFCVEDIQGILLRAKDSPKEISLALRFRELREALDALELAMGEAHRGDELEGEDSED